MIPIRTYLLILAIIAAGYVSAEENVTESGDSLRAGGIAVGAGYSEDLQQVTPQRCFKGTILSTSEEQAYLQLDRAISSLELENALGIYVSASGSYGMFVGDAKAEYLRSFQDNDYSISLNYFEYATNKVDVQIADYGVGALTKSGKNFYKDGKNPYFGLLCGDYYIASYQQGALLSMGLYIKLSSSVAKTEFNEKVGVSFSSMVNAAESIESNSAKHKISGSVTIQAFQTGGEPSQLSKILNKDSSGNYYALTCSLTAMDNCIKTANGLLDYATTNFPTQFSFEENKGLTPLGIAFSQYNPISWIGLTPSASFVTKEVLQCRKELSSKLKENQYYKQKLYPFFHQGYPVKIDAKFVKSANSILFKANTNINILRQSHGGAVDCFNFPDKCKVIKANIDARIQNITISDLKFLEDIKYSITVLGDKLYNTGGRTTESWDIAPDNSLFNVDITDTHCSFCIKYSSDTPIIWKTCFKGRQIDNDMQYKGELCKFYILGSMEECHDNAEVYKELSPFYFEAFDNKE